MCSTYVRIISRFISERTNCLPLYRYINRSVPFTIEGREYLFREVRCTPIVKLLRMSFSTHSASVLQDHIHIIAPRNNLFTDPDRSRFKKQNVRIRTSTYEYKYKIIDLRVCHTLDEIQNLASYHFGDAWIGEAGHHHSLLPYHLYLLRIRL